jgi:hypothetical protein
MHEEPRPSGLFSFMGDKRATGVEPATFSLEGQWGHLAESAGARMTGTCGCRQIRAHKTVGVSRGFAVTVFVTVHGLTGVVRLLFLL